MKSDAADRSEHHIGYSYADDLRDAGAGVKHKRQHQSVALADPRISINVDDGLNLPLNDVVLSSG